MFGSSKPAGSQNGPFSLNLDTSNATAGSNKRPAPLFGSLNTNTTSSTTPSVPLFSTAPAPTTSAPSLSFGGFALGATTTPASAPTTQAATAGGGGIFGGLGGGLGGGTGASTSTNTGGIFGNTLGTSQATQNNVQASQPGQAQVTPPTTRDPSAFSSLIERQKKRARLENQRNGRATQLPELDMDLGDLAARAQNIGRGSVRREANAVDSRAHYVLAGSGIVPGKAYEELQALDLEAPIDQPQPPREAFDVQNGQYFQDLRKKGRKQMIKENMTQVYREVDQFIEDSLGIDFDEQRQRIMEHFGLVVREEEDDNVGGSFARSAGRKSQFAETPNGSTRSVFGRSALEKTLIGTPGMGGSTTSFFGDEGNQQMGNLMRGQTARDLRDKERLYVEKVEQLNKARLAGENFPIMHHFAEVERSGGVDSPQQLAEAYGALIEMVKERPHGNDVRERQYAVTYHDDRANISSVTNLRKQLLEGSRQHLEKVFYRDLEAMVEKNPREAALGGRPTVINKVRAYIRVRDGRRDLKPDGCELLQFEDGGDYPWALIFYLLRSGHVNEAFDYVKNDSAFSSTDKRFVSYITQYAQHHDKKLSRKLQDMINGEYQQRMRIAPDGSQDPYRLACYKIIGRCELSRRNLEAVGQGVEDWIWLQFALARETAPMEERAGEEFGLEQICETITEIGQKHFQKGQAEGSGGYGTFFFMQIIAGMFEQAVEYLHSYNAVSSVHFAIALAYYGVLRVSDYTVAGTELREFYVQSPFNYRSANEFPVTQTTTGYHQINFVPLIAYYTASFRAALPVDAVDYLALICLNSDLAPASLGNAQTAASHECLRQLCLETREFARLLGDIRSDGTRIPGAIEMKSKLIRLDTHADFLRAVTTQAAAIADERGQVADAVLLFHLSEDYESVVSILNRALADACTLDLGESPMELQPLKRRDGGSPTSSNTVEVGPKSSLSLTQSTSSPAELAKNMTALYDANATYYNKIEKTTRATMFALLGLLSARGHLEASPPRFMECLEALHGVGVLPLQAQGSIPVIRSAATAFGALPQLLARCAGVSVVWAVRAIGGERERMMQQGGWDGGAGQGSLEDRKEMLSTMAKDLMVFAGLVKYRLPGRVYDMLTRVGGEVGGY
jgi:nuclear pore complex protein Nup93